MKTLKLTLAIATLSLVAFAQGATIVTTEGVGQASADPKDPTRGYEEAKTRAVRDAVERAAGTRLEADTLVVNNQLVRDQVTMNTSGYVKNVTIVEKKVEGLLATVKVKVDVITENLDKDIAAARDLVKKIGRPSLVIVIQEQTLTADGKAVANSETLASALTETFRADGWNIKDEKALNKSLSLEGAVTLGPTELKKIADLTKVSYILYGKASIRNEAKGEMFKNADFYPISGEYDLALAATDSESQIAKVAGALRMSPKTKETAVSYERTAFQVIQEKKSEIIAPVRKAILEAFRDQQTNGKEFRVTMKGLDSFTSAKDFKKAIETLQGIKEATQEDFKNGSATYKIVFLGSANDFASAIETATFKKKKLLVVSQSHNELELQLGK